MKGTTKKTRVSTGDISRLPEDIIHHVLSYIDTEEAMYSSTFCKTWYSAWLTCPTVNFHEFFHRRRYTYENRKKFLKLINTTLQRYQEQKIRIEQFNLGLLIDDSCSASHVDEWIRIAVQNGVERLKLEVLINFDSGYSLTRCIIEARSLRELSVQGNDILEWKKRVDDKIMLNHLRRLHLSQITIDDDMFRAVIAGCPLIENLSVSYCKGLKIIKVIGVDNLKKFTVCAERNQGVEVEAPNIQYVNCSVRNGSLKFYRAEKLKYLKLAGPSATFFDNFGYKFPRVEDLILTPACRRRRINISSHSIKHFVLYSTQDLSKVNIDAPNLVSFKLWNSTFFPDLSFTNAPSQWEFTIVISSRCCLDTDCFRMMKRVLAKAVGSKISLIIYWSNVKWDIIGVRKIPICPVIEVEDVELDFRFSAPSGNSNLLDALFITCHPKAIIIVQGNRNFPRFFFENLIERRNEDCPGKQETKSWYRELKDVKLEIYDETNCLWKPTDWKSLSETPMHYVKVCFRLEWESTS